MGRPQSIPKHAYLRYQQLWPIPMDDRAAQLLSILAVKISRGVESCIVEKHSKLIIHKIQNKAQT